MKIINRFKAISLFLIAAYLLAACGGTLPSSATSVGGPKVEANPVAFTGTVEAISGTQWTVGGQTLKLDPQLSLDPNIRVGDQVKVEANVSADGSVVAFRVESSSQDDVVSDPSASSAAELSSTPDASDSSGPSSTQASGNAQNEIFGTVEAITADTITVNGVTYNLADSTEIKNTLAVGDQVKLHLNVNADGTSTVREIEKSTATTVDDNSSISNGSHDGPNHDVNDDHSSTSGNGADDGVNHDSNDDHGGSGGNSGPGGG